MNRRNLPLLLMLTAGAITCIITFFREYTLLEKLIALFVVMLIFCVLGSVLKGTLDYFDVQNEKRLKEEGEVIEKGSDESEDSQEQVDETEEKDTEETETEVN